ATGKKLRSLASASCAAFTSDGGILATTPADGFLCDAACLWRMSDGKQIGRWKISEPIRAIAFSPDDKRLATSGLGGAIRLFDVERGEGLKAGRGTTGPVEKALLDNCHNIPNDSLPVHYEQWRTTVAENESPEEDFMSKQTVLPNGVARW